MNHDQFSDAFRHGYPKTCRFLVSRGAASHLAEEIAQAAWVKGWERLNQLRQPHMIGTWVNSIAKNMLRSSVRFAQRWEALTDSRPVAGPAWVDADVKRILTRCGRRDSRILSGYYLEGYTAQELARQVGMNPVTVRVRLTRIRRALRSQLAKGSIPRPC